MTTTISEEDAVDVEDVEADHLELTGHLRWTAQPAIAHPRADDLQRGEDIGVEVGAEEVVVAVVDTVDHVHTQDLGAGPLAGASRVQITIAPHPEHLLDDMEGMVGETALPEEVAVVEAAAEAEAEGAPATAHMAMRALGTAVVAEAGGELEYREDYGKLLARKGYGSFLLMTNLTCLGLRV